MFVAHVSRAWVSDDQSLVVGLGSLKTRQHSDLASAVLMVSHSVYSKPCRYKNKAH